MDINIIFKIAAVGLIIALLNQILQKAGKDEYATLTTVAGVLLALLMLLPKLSEVLKTVSDFFDL